MKDVSDEDARPILCPPFKGNSSLFSPEAKYTLPATLSSRDRVLNWAIFCLKLATSISSLFRSSLSLATSRERFSILLFSRARPKRRHKRPKVATIIFIVDIFYFFEGPKLGTPSPRIANHLFLRGGQRLLG